MAGERPSTLRYVVLDELHSHDGAQGTDVAMLLRRLGAKLGMASPGSPLGDAVPVATSATLGTGSDAVGALSEFASRLFGRSFGQDAIIGDELLSASEACGTTDYELPIPMSTCSPCTNTPTPRS